MKRPLNEGWLSLGSNVRGATGNISSASTCLTEIDGNLSISNVYQTPALNGRDADYCNAVVRIVTSLSFEELNLKCKQIERQLGRTPESKLVGRVEIDIDIVVWNGDVVRPKDFSHSYFMIGYNQIKEVALRL